MDKAEIIAERNLLFVKPDGAEINSHIQFGRPYFTEEHGWCCDCEIPRIEKRRYGAGVDGIQALLLTMSLVETLLEVKRSLGWKFLWPDTRHETLPREIFEAGHFLRTRATP
jgi:hypothetical protein